MFRQTDLHATLKKLVDTEAQALSAGKTYWNWGGTWRTQEGEYRFKRKWGAEDHSYRYFVWLRDRSILKRSPTEIVQAYPGFYVVPFDALETY